LIPLPAVLREGLLPVISITSSAMAEEVGSSRLSQEGNLSRLRAHREIQPYQQPPFPQSRQRCQPGCEDGNQQVSGLLLIQDFFRHLSEVFPNHMPDLLRRSLTYNLLGQKPPMEGIVHAGRWLVHLRGWCVKYAEIYSVLDHPVFPLTEWMA